VTGAQILPMDLDRLAGSRHLWATAPDSPWNHGAYKIVGNSVAVPRYQKNQRVARPLQGGFFICKFLVSAKSTKCGISFSLIDKGVHLRRQSLPQFARRVQEDCLGQCSPWRPQEMWNVRFQDAYRAAPGQNLTVIDLEYPP